MILCLARRVRIRRKNHRKEEGELLFKPREKKRVSQKGQSLVEALVFSLALIAILKCLLVFFWMGINVLWMEHQLYQGLICSAEQKEIKLCQETVLKQIKRLNSIGGVQSLQIKNFQNEWKGVIHWHFYKINFVIRQTLVL